MRMIRLRLFTEWKAYLVDDLKEIAINAKGSDTG